MQIPTMIGSAMSGFVHATGDVDGIYGGSPETYVRDLQWKTLGLCVWHPFRMANSPTRGV